MSPTVSIRSNNVVLSSEERHTIAKRLYPLKRFMDRDERSHFDVVLTQIGAKRTPHYYVSIKVSSGSSVTMSVHSGTDLFASMTTVIHTLAGRLRRRQGRRRGQRTALHVSPILQSAAYQSW